MINTDTYSVEAEVPITQYQQGRQTAIEYQIMQPDKFNHFALALTDI